MAGASVVALAALISRVLGLLRDRVFAASFGAGETLDAFFAAFRLPDLIYQFLITGALTAVFIPAFARELHKRGKIARPGNPQAFAFAHSIFSVVMVILTALATLFALGAPWLMPLIAPGFASEQQEIVIRLTRIMLLQPILLGVSSILSGVLNSFRRFVAYAMAPVIYNLGIILGALWFVPRWGEIGLAWGVVLGALGHLLVQAPSAWKLGFRFRFLGFALPPAGRELLPLVLPRIVGVAAQQVNALVVTFLGSSLAAGTIAVYQFAENLQAFPVGIFGASLAVAAFPLMAEASARAQAVSFRRMVANTLRIILFFIIPVTVFIILLRAQIVRVVLGAGRFSWEDTKLTLATLGVLSLAIFAHALIPLLSRAFFALRDTRTPVVASILAIVTNVTLAALWAARWGVMGLAAAYVVSSTLQVVILLAALHHRLGGLEDETVLTDVFRIVAAALLAGAVVQLIKIGVGSMVGRLDTFWEVALQLFSALLGGSAVFLAMAGFLRISTVRELPRVIRPILRPFIQESSPGEV
jgi:putative peptidoglycan lipid II flippase